MTLTTKERKKLKAEAHHLKPVIRVGQHGISEGVIAETNIALNTHELIKVQIQSGDRDERVVGATELAEKTHASLVHNIGKVFILYRKNENK